MKSFYMNISEKYPQEAKWIREGGLYVIVCNLITVLKYLMFQFLPYPFTGLSQVDFGRLGMPMKLFGVTFKWNISATALIRAVFLCSHLGSQFHQLHLGSCGGTICSFMGI